MLIKIRFIFSYKIWKTIILWSILILNINLSQAQDIKLPGIDFLSKTRRVVNINDYPWRIIGRVQTDLGEKCTGFFITPRIIVTAAHCLWIKKTQQFVSARSIHFLWGYQRGYYRQNISIQKVMINSHYKGIPVNRFSIYRSIYDKAFLLLDHSPIKNQDLVPIGKGPQLIGSTISLGGYQQDKKEIFIVDSHCKITQLYKINTQIKLLYHDCEATYGSSGAPLLTINNNQQWEIMGMQIGASVNHKGGIANLLNIDKD